MRVSFVDEERGPAIRAEPERLDPSGFGMLYETHRLAVYRYLRAKTANEEDALDLAADTFERAFASLGRFRRRDGGVQAWLLRIARNTAIDAHRRARRTTDIADADVQLGRMALEANRLEERRPKIVDLLGSLPESQREPLLLRYAAGLTAREIGAVLGKREGAIQKQIQRGIAALREASHDDA